MSKITDRRIDEQFRHLVEDLDHDMSTPLDWHFYIRHPDESKLEHFAESLEDQYEAGLIDVLDITDKGEENRKDLCILVRGALSPDDVKQIRDDLIEKAARADLKLADITSYEVIDEATLEAFFGWLDLDDATWRLHYIHDIGETPEGAPMLYEYAIVADSEDPLEHLADTLAAMGFTTDRRDDEDGPLLLARIQGVNDGKALTASFKSVQKATDAVDARLLGVQFPMDEDLGNEATGNGND